MRAASLLLCAAAAAVAAEPRTAHIYAQPLTVDPPPPSRLAEVRYDPAAPSLSSVAAYEAPDVPPEARLVRVGAYDAAAGRWAAGTTLAAADNFAKGYSPHLVLAVDAAGEVVSAACRGVGVDAGHTRDFGPRLVVVPDVPGARPLLDRPVVLSAEGKKVEPEQEKTFLQKYWWMIGIAIFVAMSGGGGEK